MDNDAPVIDLQLSDISTGINGIRNKGKVIEQLRTFSKDVGFTYLTNHGIQEEKIRKGFDISKQCFNLPESTKRKMRFSPETLVGHHLLDEVRIRNGMKQYKEGFDRALHKNVYPNEVPDFKAVSEDLVDDLVKLNMLILQLLAECVGLPPHTFTAKHKRIYKEDNLSIFRMNHYPPVNDVEDNATRCVVHTDVHTITLLLQDNVGGLKLRNRNRKWIDAVPVSGRILLFFGNLFEIWTGGEIKAIEHAVPFPTDPIRRSQSRYSMALFVLPDDDVIVEPMMGEKNKYAAVNGRDYVFNHILNIHGGKY